MAQESEIGLGMNYAIVHSCLLWVQILGDCLKFLVIPHGLQSPYTISKGSILQIPVSIKLVSAVRSNSTWYHSLWGFPQMGGARLLSRSRWEYQSACL